MPLFAEQEVDLDAFLTMTCEDFSELGIGAQADLDRLAALLARLQALQSEGQLGEAMERFVRRQRRHQQREAQKAQTSHSLMLAATGNTQRMTPSPPRLAVAGEMFPHKAGGMQVTGTELPSKRRSSARRSSPRRRRKGETDVGKARPQSLERELPTRNAPSSPTRRFFRRSSAHGTEQDPGPALVKVQPGAALTVFGGMRPPPLPLQTSPSPELQRREKGRQSRTRRPGSAG